MYYKELFKLDAHLSEIFRGYAESLVKGIESSKIDNLLLLIRDGLSRWVIYNNCERNFYIQNYDNKQVKNYASHAFYLGILNVFTRLYHDLEDEIDAESDEIRGTIAELQRDYEEEMEDIPLDEIIGLQGENKTIKRGIKDLDLSVKQLPSVILDLLINCTNLEFLNLEDNQLKQINLFGLRQCERLQYLNISKNQIPFVDLYPLRKCTNLQWLILSKNYIVTINLIPIEEFTNLIELKLDENKLTTLDLKPLKKCIKLEELDISKNNIDLIDVTPLENCIQMEYFGVDNSTKLLWRKSALPKKEDLPEGLQEHYSRLTIV